MTKTDDKKAFHGGNVFAAARDLGISWRDVLDYSANINPLGPPPGLKKHLFDDFDLTLHYPEPYALEWRTRLADLHGLSPAEVVAGNGSTALMYLTARVLQPKKPVVAVPSFAEYEQAALHAGVIAALVKCNPQNDFEITDDVIDRIFGLEPDMMFLASPTSPAGRVISDGVLDRALSLAEKNKTWLVLDEAFLDFTDKAGVASRVKDNPWLVVLRSLTKFYALPGLRLGYLTAHASVTERLLAKSEPWSMNAMALAAGFYCLDQAEYAFETRAIVDSERARLTENLKKLDFGKVFPSSANYILVKLKANGLTEARLCEAMKNKGILIRPCSSFQGLDGYVRLAVKSEEAKRPADRNVGQCVTGYHRLKGLTVTDRPDKELLVRWIMDAARRAMAHYGFWFWQTEYEQGMETALEMEKQAGDLSIGIQMNRLAKVLGFEMKDGAPAALWDMDENRLKEILYAFCANWLANDGIWFQALENTEGMSDAKRINDTCWSRFAPLEASRIKVLVGLPDNGGLEALKTALQYRLYAQLNRWEIVDETPNSFSLHMNDCRVQSTRKNKGLPDYPCKSAGEVEYKTFSKTIDPRIKVECLGCPPDYHPPEWYCGWKFTIDEVE